MSHDLEAAIIWLIFAIACLAGGLSACSYGG